MILSIYRMKIQIFNSVFASANSIYHQIILVDWLIWNIANMPLSDSLMQISLNANCILKADQIQDKDYADELREFRKSLLKSSKRDQWPHQLDLVASPLPVLVPKQLTLFLDKLGDILGRAITSIVERWWSDLRANFPDQMPLPPLQEDILRVPLQPFLSLKTMGLITHSGLKDPEAGLCPPSASVEAFGGLTISSAPQMQPGTQKMIDTQLLVSPTSMLFRSARSTLGLLLILTLEQRLPTRRFMKKD